MIGFINGRGLKSGLFIRNEVMPLGIITDEQLNREISSLKRTSLDDVKVVDIRRGRNNTLEIPASLRAVIAEEVIESGHSKDVAASFGVSKSSVDAYKNGATSTSSYNEPNQALARANQQVRDQISDNARSRLTSALNHLTDDKIDQSKAKDIAAIAKDMSVIVKNMEPDGPVIQNNTQVIIYKPRMRDEDEFDVITVNE